MRKVTITEISGKKNIVLVSFLEGKKLMARFHFYNFNNYSHILPQKSCDYVINGWIPTQEDGFILVP